MRITAETLSEIQRPFNGRPDLRQYMKSVECAPLAVMEAARKQYDIDLAKWEEDQEAAWKSAAGSF